MLQSVKVSLESLKHLQGICKNTTFAVANSKERRCKDIEKNELTKAAVKNGYAIRKNGNAVSENGNAVSQNGNAVLENGNAIFKPQKDSHPNNHLTN